jgi:hypothetical protein
VFLFAVSRASLASQECGKELLHALALRKRIIPVAIEPGITPEAAPDSLQDIGWIFLRPEDDAAGSLDRLGKAILLDLDHLRRHTRFLIRARDWQRIPRDRSLLLRGALLREAERWLDESPDKEPIPAEEHVRLIKASRQAEVRRRIWQAAAALAFAAVSAAAV